MRFASICSVVVPSLASRSFTLLGAAAERDDRDHGGDADDAAEHREERAQLVRPQRCQRDEENLESHCYDLGDGGRVFRCSVSLSTRPPVHQPT